jgi:hypothetical protein
VVGYLRCERLARDRLVAGRNEGTDSSCAGDGDGGRSMLSEIGGIKWYRIHTATAKVGPKCLPI